VFTHPPLKCERPRPLAGQSVRLHPVRQRFAAHASSASLRGLLAAYSRTHGCEAALGRKHSPNLVASQSLLIKGLRTSASSSKSDLASEAPISFSAACRTRAWPLPNRLALVWQIMATPTSLLVFVLPVNWVFFEYNDPEVPFLR
jgi:hypothetical protein